MTRRARSSFSSADKGSATFKTDAVSFREELIELIPFLRAFSRSICGNNVLADDMAQEALAKAWQARDSFQPNSNLKAWLFTILRNEYYSYRRRAWRQSELDSTAAEALPSAADGQLWSVELNDTARALRYLPAEQRDALILVGAAGFSYKEAAKICGCALGTIKSRVARARQLLADILDDLEGSSIAPRQDTTEDAVELSERMDELVKAGAIVSKHKASRKKTKRR